MHSRSVRFALRATALSLAVGTMAAGGLPRSPPSKPVRIISPFSAGSPPDALGRLVSQQMTERS